MSTGAHPQYRFVSYRKIDGADYTNDERWAQPWLSRDDFREADLSQLTDILEEWGIGGDPFALPCQKFEGLAEVGFEIWDVVDEAGQQVFTIWTYTDSGMIYRYGSTERVGEIVQFGAEFEDDQLAEELEQSRLAQKDAEPDASLPPRLG